MAAFMVKAAMAVGGCLANNQKGTLEFHCNMLATLDTQQLPPRESSTAVSPEWATVKRELGARDRLEWNTRPEADWEGKHP